MNLTEGYRIRQTTLFRKRCVYCGSVTIIPYEKMNFSGPTFTLCKCGHNVQFTDDWGRCPADVKFSYGRKRNG